MPRLEQKTLAQVAYEAYGTMLRLYKDGEETTLRAWEDLPPKERAAWQYVTDTIERQVLALVSR